MNSVNLIGRLYNEPTVRYSSNGEMCIASYGLAVDRRYKKDGEPTADFINIKAFGKGAELVEKYFKKGLKVAVVGHIQTGPYTNKDGNKVYTVEVVADSQEFVERKQDAVQSAGADVSDVNTEPDFMDIPDDIDDELPFA